MDEPSPRPWRIEHRGHGAIVVDANGVIVARVDYGRRPVDEANAAAICKAVNQMYNMPWLHSVHDPQA